ncbi:MAG: non-canonical purine NTP pyrophosphatase, partial [Chromatiales bacterium]
PERNCSSAELAPETKNSLSHRAKAMQCLVEKLSVE